MRLYGLCALAAVASVGWQAPGLVGPTGVLPTGVSEAALYGASALAAVGAVGMIAGVLPGPGALLVHGGYLALSVWLGPFLRYQWDSLLLESAVVMALVAPWRPWMPAAPAPSPWAVGLARLLVFKLMLFAGLVKLWSGDPTWADWSALTYHYWTQPLPNALSWWAHHLPDTLHVLAVGAMFLAELVLPVGIVLGRWGRRVFFAGTVALMLGLALTGSYGTFQALTIVLAVLLLDDGVLQPVVTLPPRPFAPGWRAWLVTPPAVALLMLNLLLMLGQSTGWQLPGPLLAPLRLTAPARLVHAYGLFAVMTTERPEIGVEVTADGRTWHEVPFLYKPTDPGLAPLSTGLHLPRLDWHLWFTALAPCHAPRTCFARCEADPVLAGTLQAVVTGRKAALGLVGPLPVADPVAARAVRWSYRFTAWEEGWRTGATWERTRLGLQCPPVRRPSEP